VSAAGLTGLEPANVTRWLLEHVDGLVGSIEFHVISGGHSNITYGLTDADGRRLVLRRPPLGDLPRGAHDVAREHRILSALGSTGLPVPAVRGLCTDIEVTGAPFYVMDLIDGAVVSRPAQVDEGLPTEASRIRASEQMVDVLAALHAVDIDAIGLGDLSRREGFIERQLGQLAKVWDRTRTRELPIYDEVLRRLSINVPTQRRTGLVHSDYRLGNMLFAPDGTLTAVLDWELCTLGESQVDLAFMLNNWELPGDGLPAMWMEVPPTTVGGFLDRETLVARYAAATGSDVSDLWYFRAFTAWKMGVIAEGMKGRYERGEMAGTVDLGHLDRRVVAFAEYAAEHLRASGR
jgi:aminoglycoside phosphotransferase (APT) family kinase protein